MIETQPDLQIDVVRILNRSQKGFTDLLNLSTMAATGLVGKTSLILLITLIIVTLAAPFIINAITNPIANLVGATRELASGNLKIKVPLGTDDEIGALALSFNEMTQALMEKELALQRATEKLVEANRELKEIDRLKSDFLASMSHELRTPLAIVNLLTKYRSPIH